MRLKLVTSVVVAICCVGLAGVGADDSGPVFLRWLVPGNPGDDAIRIYWDASQRGELDAEGEIDLGTMLFHRGYPDDAIDAFERAAKLDDELPEPWFRIGLVNHRRGEVRRARTAYTKCLDRRSGHGWCNFYRGLLEEQQGRAPQALEFYRTAYRHAPELADPRVNPEVLYSKLQLGATIDSAISGRFLINAPLAYMQPARVRRARTGEVPPATTSPVEEPEAPDRSTVNGTPLPPPTEPSAGSSQQVGPGTSRRVTPPPQPAPTAPPEDVAPTEEIPSYLHIRSTSPEATLRPWWWPDPARRIPV
jgi:hypothetical protein